METNTLRTCSFDRVSVNGDDFIEAIVPNSGSVLNFQEKFGMTLPEAQDVSDHMPIKFEVEW